MPGVVLLVSGPPELVLVQRIMPRHGDELCSKSLCFLKTLDTQRSGLPCPGDGSLTLPSQKSSWGLWQGPNPSVCHGMRVDHSCFSHCILTSAESERPGCLLLGELP